MTSFLQKLGFGLKKSSAKLTGGISSIFTKRRVDAQTLDELEELLISSDIGVRASAKIIGSFAKRRLNKDAGDTEIKNELAADIEAILQPCEQPLAIDDTQKPFVILMVGVNGAGKTTTIGKLAAKFKAGGKQVSFIAGDTFRAAAVEQLEVWGQRCGIRVFKGPAGCDAAGLCYDGLTEAVRQKTILFYRYCRKTAKQNRPDGRTEKIVRVIGKVLPKAPHATLLTIDATTGQNALSQVQTFKEMVDVTGLVVTKLDGTAKGGILVAVAEEQPSPIHYIGVGEGIDDLDVFNAADYAKNLLEL